VGQPVSEREKLERIAQDYHASAAVPDIHIENLCQEYFIGWLLEQVPRGARVLELGYGDGLVTAALAGADCRLTVVEGAKALVERSRARHPQVATVHSLFEEFEPPSAFDLVVASHVLEHVDDPRAVLRRMAGWLAGSGKIVVVVPNRNSLHRQLAVIMGLQPQLDTLSKRDLMVGHQRVYSLEGLLHDMAETGLRCDEVRGFFLKVLPNSMMLDYTEELLRALNAISASLPAELMANIAVVAGKRTA
jgi:2-polyprenyl-3-methyl-5-hydroxy-6-metoxy-1,4-benzoquinol methylase